MDEATVLHSLKNPDGTPDTLRCALFLAVGREEGERLLREALLDRTADQETAGRLAQES